MIIHCTSVHFCRPITGPPESSTLTTPGIFATTLRHAAHRYPTLFLQASRSRNHAYLAESALCWSKAACVLNIQPQIQVRLAAGGCIRVIPELRVTEAGASVLRLHLVRRNEWLGVAVWIQESGPKTQGALVEACVHNDWAGVHVLSVEVSKPKVRNQVLDFRFLRLAQYTRKLKSRIKFLLSGSSNLHSIFESMYSVRRQAAAQRVRYGKDVQPVSQAWCTD